MGGIAHSRSPLLLIIWSITPKGPGRDQEKERTRATMHETSRPCLWGSVERPTLHTSKIEWDDQHQFLLVEGSLPYQSQCSFYHSCLSWLATFGRLAKSLSFSTYVGFGRRWMAVGWFRRKRWWQLCIAFVHGVKPLLGSRHVVDGRVCGLYISEVEQTITSSYLA